MRSRLKSIVPLGILSVSLPLVAQNSYHVEMVDGPQLPTGTVKLVILANDSQKIIEAYHAKAACKNNEGSQPPVAAGTEQSFDGLSVASDSMGRMGRGGASVSQEPLIMPGRRFITGLLLGPQPSGCMWESSVDAVLYSDGTYDGAEADVRKLQAHRDGIVASVRSWDHIFREMGTPDPLMAVDQSLAAIAGEAKRRRDEDLARLRSAGCTSSLACQYWYGRGDVDSSIATQTKAITNSRPPNETYRRTAQFINRLSTKIDADTALKILDKSFPLPTAVAESSPQSVTPTTSKTR